MARELSISLSAIFVKGLSGFSDAASATIDVNGNRCFQTTATIGTTDQTLNVGEVGSGSQAIGYAFFINIAGSTGVPPFDDLTSGSDIKIGSDGSSYPIILKAGEVAVMRWNDTAIHAKAVTAPADLFYTIIEN